MYCFAKSIFVTIKLNKMFFISKFAVKYFYGVYLRKIICFDYARASFESIASNYGQIK